MNTEYETNALSGVNREYPGRDNGGSSTQAKPDTIEIKTKKPSLFKRILQAYYDSLIKSEPFSIL